MPRTTADSKSKLIREVEHAFTKEPKRKFTVGELVDMLGGPGGGPSERTVRRYLVDVAATGRLPLCNDEEDKSGRNIPTRWWLMAEEEGARVPIDMLHLDVREGAALYLAARLLAQQTDERNDHIAGAMRRLAEAMPATLAPALTRITSSPAYTADSRNATDIFSALVIGWAQRRIVSIQYLPADSLAPYLCRLAPYLLEPIAIGRTIYVIGHASPPGAMRTFKLERIQRATLTSDAFAVPADLDVVAQLQRAWGVMVGEQPVTVRLRFSPDVRKRVRETLWHASQRIEDTADGGCMWEAEIGDVREIAPWVRGWGSDCEVLAPEDLRTSVRNHVQRLAEMYGCLPPAEAGQPGEVSTETEDALGMLFD